MSKMVLSRSLVLLLKIPLLRSIQPCFSRTRVFVLNLLDTSHIRQVLDRAIANSEHGFPDLQIDEQALDLIAETAEGDARRSLNALETGCCGC